MTLIIFGVDFGEGIDDVYWVARNAVRNLKQEVQVRTSVLEVLPKRKKGYMKMEMNFKKIEKDKAEVKVKYKKKT